MNLVDTKVKKKRIYSKIVIIVNYNINITKKIAFTYTNKIILEIVVTKK
jgi:hypothetical protein